MGNAVLHTRLLKVHPVRPEADLIREAGGLLREGALVAFPTETVYGLGANALDSQAVAGIFRAKGRPADNPLIVHLEDLNALGRYIEHIPPVAVKLSEIFWPGPLTLVIDGEGVFPVEVTGGLNTVAVRSPDHPVAAALMREAKVPVAAPSANLSGRPSPTTAAHVMDDLAGKIDLVLDGGACGLGVESTVLDITGDFPVLLRPGGINLGDLEQVLGLVKVDPGINGFSAPDKKAKSPGMKYTHYAPSAPLILFTGTAPLKVARAVAAKAEVLAAQGSKVGILSYRETSSTYQGKPYRLVITGSIIDPPSIAVSLYDSLRKFDRLEVDVILAEGIPPEGLGLAVLNRLRRASGGAVVHVE